MKKYKIGAIVFGFLFGTLGLGLIINALSGKQEPSSLITMAIVTGLFAIGMIINIILWKKNGKINKFTIHPSRQSPASSNKVSSIKYIYKDNSIQRSDGKPITKKEIPGLIEESYQRTIETENAYKNGSRNIFSDNSFSTEENIFFQNVYSKFTEAKLKPNLIKVSRLASGIFNVDYIGVCYIGKVQIKDGKRYYIQYTIGSYNPHDEWVNSLNELIDIIPRWVKYVNYCKRH